MTDTTDPQTAEPELTETQKAYNVAQYEMFQLAAYGHCTYTPRAELLTAEGKADQADYNDRIRKAREELEASLLRLVAEHAESFRGGWSVPAAWLRSLADDPAEVSLLAVTSEELEQAGLVPVQPASSAAVSPPPATDRAALSAKLWAVAEHHIVAEWICCEPLEPRHTLCAKGYAALGMARTLLVDGDPEKAWNPKAPLLDAILPALPTGGRAGLLRAGLLRAADIAEDVAESLRKHHEFERSTGALDVMTELRRLAAGERDEQQAQQDGAETRGPWGTVPGCACPHPADEHSIYGCADGCGCAWMPKRKPMDPVHILGVEAEPTPVAASTPRANETGGTVAEKRPRCPHCQMPHDLTPGSMGVRVCESIRRRIAEGVQRHGEGDHGMCCRADCDVLRQRDAAAPVAGQPPADTGEEAREETVHARPGPDDNGISPCCGRPPFEFRGERLTRDPAAVTCPTSPAVVAEPGKEA